MIAEAHVAVGQAVQRVNSVCGAAAEDIRRTVAAPRRAEQRRQGRDFEGEWKAEPQHRVRLRALPADGEAGEFKEAVKKDQGRVQRKFWPLHRRKVGAYTVQPMNAETQGTIHDINANDTHLPPAPTTEAASRLQTWCQHGSWVICANCHSLSLRHMKEVDLRRTGHPTQKKCKFCKSDTLAMPTAEHVPDKLRDLDVDIVKALHQWTSMWASRSAPITGIVFTRR